MKSITGLLRKAIDLFEEKGEEHGNAYMRGGKIMKSFFPEGVTLKTESDFLRYDHFRMCVQKLNRYAEHITVGGHVDSSDDLIVYSAMLRSFTDDN